MRFSLKRSQTIYSISLFSFCIIRTKCYSSATHHLGKHKTQLPHLFSFVMFFRLCCGCPWLRFVVFHHWPIDSNKASPGSYGWYSSTFSEPPRALHLWFWWTAPNQQTAEGSHALNLRALCGGLCDEPSSVRGWEDISHPGDSEARSRPGPWMNPENTLPLVCSWYPLTDTISHLPLFRQKIMFFCSVVRNSFWQRSLSWQPVITFLSEYKCFFFLAASSLYNC